MSETRCRSNIALHVFWAIYLLFATVLILTVFRPGVVGKSTAVMVFGGSSTAVDAKSVRFHEGKAYVDTEDGPWVLDASAVTVAPRGKVINRPPTPTSDAGSSDD